MAKKNKFILFNKGILGAMRDLFKRLGLKTKILIAKILSRGAGNGVYYVNGPDTLPPPLSREDEAKYLEELLYNDKARDLLIEHNLRLVVYIAKKFESTGICIEDLVSIGTIGLIKGINTFRADKNIKLATYASR